MLPQNPYVNLSVETVLFNVGQDCYPYPAVQFQVPVHERDDGDLQQGPIDSRLGHGLTHGNKPQVQGGTIDGRMDGLID